MNLNRPKPALEEIEVLRNELMQKEQVIEELTEQLVRYQEEVTYLQPIMHWVHKAARLLWLITPKLGRLNHYPPREIEYPIEYRLPATFAAPMISIVTPSFNQAKYIAKTIDSILDQNYPNLEYFVQDGDSHDGTEQILQGFEDRITGWTSAPDSGQTQAINLGFRRTQGEIMAWLNSDDLLIPGALARVADYFAKHPEIDVVYGYRILIDEEDREIGRWILPGHINHVLSWADFVPQETLFWRRRIWDSIGGELDESFRFAMDWDMLLRFRDAGAHMARIPYFLGAFRIHDAQKTSAIMSEVGKHEMTQLRRRVLGRDVTMREIRRALLPYSIIHLVLDFSWRLRRFLKLKVQADRKTGGHNV
jgi:glycosyltransferase involved in cell wall biosynthesis